MHIRIHIWIVHFNPFHPSIGVTPAADTPREMAIDGQSSVSCVTVVASCQMGAEAAMAPSTTDGIFMRIQPDNIPGDFFGGKMLGG